MTKKQKEIKRVERKIRKLQERLQKLKELPDFYDDEELSEIEDFPFKDGSHFIYLQNNGIHTVEDLLNFSPGKILEIRSFGKSSLEKINKWMDKHDLKFVD